MQSVFSFSNISIQYWWSNCLIVVLNFDWRFRSKREREREKSESEVRKKEIERGREREGERVRDIEEDVHTTTRNTTANCNLQLMIHSVNWIVKYLSCRHRNRIQRRNICNWNLSIILFVHSDGTFAKSAAIIRES